jgi:hypothetical protein
MPHLLFEQYTHGNRHIIIGDVFKYIFRASPMGIKHFMCLNMRGAAITSSNIFTITGVIIPMGQTFYMYNLLLNIHINSLPWVAVASRELMPVSLLFGNFSVFTCLLRQDSLCLATGSTASRGILCYVTHLKMQSKAKSAVMHPF